MEGVARPARAKPDVHAAMRRLAVVLASLPVLLGATGETAPPASPTWFPQDAAIATADYRVGPADKLNITVFQVKDLSLDNVQVDASGQILLPLIGAVAAQGKTTAELSAEIARRLGEHYLQSPGVSVMVAEALSQKVSVEGAVNEAGVFPLKGRTSLLEAVAMAKGPSKGADLHRVAILRTIDGLTHSGTFDLASIRAGKARNPEVQANDVVIVADSKIKGLWHGLVEALPALIVFSYL